MKKLLVTLTTILAGIALFMSCNNSAPGTAQQFDFDIEFSPFPPIDIDSNATPEQLASFAWNEFLALNWKSSFHENGKRDYPDTGWSYSQIFPDLTVWETYAHRTELRPYNDTMLPMDSSAPHYNYGVELTVAYRSSFKLWHNLDENNEIGSCNVYLGDENNRVLYQAKVNREEYEYILKNYPTYDSLKQAAVNTQALIQNPAEYYKTGAPCKYSSEKKIICLPCGGVPGPDGKPVTGAIEIKTAWRRATPPDFLNLTRYIIRNVIVYDKIGFYTIYANELWVLLGMHIIHKTQNYPDFIFATFEHEDLQNHEVANFTYTERDDSGNEISDRSYTDYPRLKPIPLVAKASTDFVHAKLSAINPNSPLNHYRLIGVQANPKKDTAEISRYLANYVIESDTTLGLFKGSGINNPHDGKPNTFYQGEMLTVSGCQGCHGAAQTNFGSDFSFLLESTSTFFPVKEPDGSFADNKLLKYKKAFSAIKERSNMGPAK